MSHLRTVFFASVTSLAFLAVASSAFAQVQPDPTSEDPANPPKPIPKVETDPPAKIPVIEIPKNVLGDGKRLTPHVFDSTTKCYLKISGLTPEQLDSLEWDLLDAPPESEFMADAKWIVQFDLANPGLYQIGVHWNGGWRKLWLEIKGPNSPPRPPPILSLADQLRAAFAEKPSPDVKTDAAKLRGMVGSLADALTASKFANHGSMLAAWKIAQTANQWPTGKYPKMPDVIRSAIPTVEEDVPLDATNTPAILANLRILEATAKLISEGK